MGVGVFQFPRVERLTPIVFDMQADTLFVSVFAAEPTKQLANMGPYKITTHPTQGGKL